MSFRRDGEKANAWRKQLEPFSELLERAKLPAFLFQDKRTWFYFLLHGNHVEDGIPPVDVPSIMSVDQKRALYELISMAYSEQERIGMSLWLQLKHEFEKT